MLKVKAKQISNDCLLLLEETVLRQVSHSWEGYNFVITMKCYGVTMVQKYPIQGIPEADLKELLGEANMLSQFSEDEFCTDYTHKIIMKQLAELRGELALTGDNKPLHYGHHYTRPGGSHQLAQTAIEATKKKRPFVAGIQTANPKPEDQVCV